LKRQRRIMEVRGFSVRKDDMDMFLSLKMGFVNKLMRLKVGKWFFMEEMEG